MSRELAGRGEWGRGGSLCRGLVGDDVASEDFGELSGADDAGAKDPGGADEGDYGGLDAAGAGATVKDEAGVGGEGLADVGGGGGGDAARGVGTGADKRAAEGFEECEGGWVVWAADGDAVAAAGGLGGDVASFGEDDGEGAGPESGGEFFGAVGPPKRDWARPCGP